jgi:D-threo-aldose 1-dehydrogenase
MRLRRLGRTGVSVSVLGFGGAPIGNLYAAVDEDAALAAAHASWDGGVRYFDTSPHYGLGLSERRLGAALKGRPREEFSISTKVGRMLVGNPHPTGSDLQEGGFDVPDTVIRTRDYSRDGVLRSLEASLSRLDLDRIDVVYVHDPEDDMDDALNQAIPTLVQLRDEGVVGAVGAGMNFWQPLLRIATQTDVDVVMVAGRWTLLDRSAGLLLDACLDRQVAVVAAAPFNSGISAQPWPADDAYFDYGPAPADVLARARAYATACTDRGTTLPHAAVQFPLRHPAVACVVAGIRTPGQAKANTDWATHDLDPAQWEALDSVDRDA